LRKIFKISVLTLLIIGLGATLFFLSNGELTRADVPKDVPIISGKILAIETFRSDELNRGIEIAVETNLSIPEVAQYYTDEFAKRGIKPFGIPAFWGNDRDLESSTEASGGGETRNRQQVMVQIQSEAPITLVRISVLGDSMISLPK
jgi:hypothetical protein